jgi:hypothetical protein
VSGLDEAEEITFLVMVNDGGSSGGEGSIGDNMLRTRLVLEGEKCVEGTVEYGRVACEWHDMVANKWSAQGCSTSLAAASSQASEAVSVQCRCRHLTLFSIRERTVEISDQLGIEGKGLRVLLTSVGLMALVIVIIFANYIYFPSSHPACLMSLLTGWIDILIDVFNAQTLFLVVKGCGPEIADTIRPYAIASLSLLLVSTLFCAFSNAITIASEARRSASFKAWALSHKKQVVGVWLLALPSPSVLGIIRPCRLFGTQSRVPATSHGFSRRINRSSALHLVLEDGLQSLVITIQILLLFLLRLDAHYIFVF